MRIFTLICLCLLSACSFSTGATTGAAVGGAGGAVIGSEHDHAAEGALIGASSGALVGTAAEAAIDADEQEKINERKRDQLLQHQYKVMEQQRREFEDLNRQQLIDQKFKEKYGSGEEE